MTVSERCAALHEMVWKGTRHAFTFDVARLPQNGIYVLFERGEQGHNGDRIVRVGTHTGDGQLRSRLTQHFIAENKDRSIFRKNIGRCLLNRRGDPFLAEWELDRTSRAARERYGPEPDGAKRQAVEAEVTAYLRDRCSFVTFAVPDAETRLTLESRLISTVSLCDRCGASSGWLGRYSPKHKIRDSGLWQVNELGKEPLTAADLERLAISLA